MPGAAAAPSAAAEQDDASGTMPRDSLGCHEQDSLVSVAALEPAPVPEEELIDISMDSPVDGEDARWYKCASVAAFNATLEFSATTPIGGKVMPGRVIEALEHADTRAGKRRVRSHKGWFSLVSTNGTRCVHMHSRFASTLQQPRRARRGPQHARTHAHYMGVSMDSAQAVRPVRWTGRRGKATSGWETCRAAGHARCLLRPDAAAWVRAPEAACPRASSGAQAEEQQARFRAA